MIRATRDFAEPDPPKLRGSVWARRQAQIAHEVAQLNGGSASTKCAPIATNPAIRQARVGQVVYLRWSAVLDCDRVMLTAARAARGVVQAVSRDGHGAVQVAWESGSLAWMQAEYLCDAPEVDW